MINVIREQPHHSPAIKRWVLTTGAILTGAFGQPNGNEHQNTSEFIHADGGPLYMNMSSAAQQAYHQRQTDNRCAVLESVIQQLEVLAPPSAQVATDDYAFHAYISEVSRQLYADGHYKQAALEAFIRVIGEVKARTGLPLDGDGLMNRAFGSEGQMPVMRFNSLQTNEERDEQKGMMLLFKGIVALRNSKAHGNRLFNDPLRAHEYLALASLLMRLLEIANDDF